MPVMMYTDQTTNTTACLSQASTVMSQCS